MTTKRYAVSFAAVVAAVVTGAAIGCGSSSKHGPRAGESPWSGPVMVEMRILSAEIHGQKVDGQPWDGYGQKSDAMHPTLARYLEQHAELAWTQEYVGIPVESPDFERSARRGPAADPMVLLDVGGQVFRSSVRANSFHPAWDFTLQFVAYRPEEMSVRVHVVDYDGPGRHDAIGSTVIPLPALLAQPLHQVPHFGSVDRLLLEVRTVPLPAPEEAPAETRLAVPGNPTWTDTGIRVTAGQLVMIGAADEVCSKGPEKCSGPEGQRLPSEDYNHPGFGYLGHAALIAWLGDTRFAVGRGLRFVAPASGVLRLGVNDVDSHNNLGSYAVQVLVEPTPVIVDERGQ